MPLNGIDISSWQSDLEPASMATTDFIIMKATGGTGYSNPAFKKHADATLRAGKLLGCYHFAREEGCGGSALKEADFFIKAFKPYVGKAIPFLDWEAGALALGPAWAKAWLDRVKAKTGVTPGIYMSKSACRDYDWAAVAKTYPLWVAQYPDYSETGYKARPWTDGGGYGAWKSPLLFQYTSSGKVAGYAGRLDLNIFYGTRADWKGHCAKAGAADKKKAATKTKAKTKGAKAMAIDRAMVAVQVMRHLCECDLHGYSQPGRFGTSGFCNVSTDAGTAKVKKGDRDCSSAVCEAWELALQGSAYEGRITRYHYTGDMRSVFLASGLFEWKPLTYDAQPGDIYLDEANHTAMCIQNDAQADLLGEFSISETGGIDGEPGDQTGRESYIHDYYESWDGILAYNHKADGGEASGGSSSGKAGVSDLPMPRYRVAVMIEDEKTWLDWMCCLRCECGHCADTYGGIPGVGIVDIEFDGGSLGPNGWYTKNMKGDKLIGLTVYYDTANPAKTGYYQAKYRVHWLGRNPAWGKFEYDDDDGGAGNDRDQIDMIELTIVPC